MLIVFHVHRMRQSLDLINGNLLTYLLTYLLTSFAVGACVKFYDASSNIDLI